jgi:hypothetical protein
VLPQSLAVGAVALTLIDHAALLHHILQPVREPRSGGQPIPAGTPGLLVVPLHTLRKVEVGDKPHVGFVDAHTESDGGNHHHSVFTEEPGLVAGTHGRVEPRVVREGRNALLHQELRRFFDRCP